MSDLDENTNVEPLYKSPRPCPKCKQEHVDPPRPRAVSSSGRTLGYCREHLRSYQNTRNQALTTIGRAEAILAKATTNNTEDDPDLGRLIWAVKTLENTKRGRPRGENICPRCEYAQRAPSSSYCVQCTTEYRRNRREFLKARLIQLAAHMELSNMSTLEAAEVQQLKNIMPPRHNDFSDINPEDLDALRRAANGEM